MDGVWEKLEIWVLYECDRTALILIWRSYLRLLGHRIGQFTVVRDPRLNLRSAVCSDAHHRVKETRDRTDMIQSGGEGGQAIHIGIANMSGTQVRVLAPRSKCASNMRCSPGLASHKVLMPDLRLHLIVTRSDLGLWTDWSASAPQGN